jgi:signal transduction histidine kinase
LYTFLFQTKTKNFTLISSQRNWLYFAIWACFGHSLSIGQSADTVAQFVSVLIEQNVHDSPEHLNLSDFKPFDQVFDKSVMTYQNNECTIWLRFDRAKWDSTARKSAAYFHFGTRHQSVDGFAQTDKGWQRVQRSAYPEMKNLPYSAMLVPNAPEINLFQIKPAAYRTRPFTVEFISQDAWNLRQYQYIKANSYQIIIWFALVAIVIYITLLSTLQYVIHRDITYVYYFCFLATQLANFFSQRLDFLFPNNAILHFFTSQGNQISSYIGHACYFAYALHFLQIKKSMPWLFYPLRVISLSLILCMLLHFILYYGLSRQDIALNMYYAVRYFLAGFVFINLIIISFTHLPLRGYLLSGSILIFLALLYWLYFGVMKIPEYEVLIHPGLLYYCCLAIQILIFHTGLSVRTKRLDRARQQAVLDLTYERQRISDELHDDLSTSLHSINVRVAEFIQVQKPEMLSQIKEMLTDCSDRLEGIIWATRGGNDQANHLTEKMLSHLHQQSMVLQEQVEMEICPEVYSLVMSDAVKFNLYLIYKESLKNIEKHALATQIKVRLCVEKSELILLVTDNGIGIDLNMNHLGNGLRNTTARAKRIGATIERVSRPDFEGTKVRVVMPLSHLNTHQTRR